MGLGDILPKGPLRSRLSDGESEEDITVSDLRDMYGDEAVDRALSYMESLSEADENFRESVSQEQMEEGYDEAAKTYTDDEDAEASDRTKVEQASRKWAEESSESGLGLDN